MFSVNHFSPVTVFDPVVCQNTIEPLRNADNVCLPKLDSAHSRDMNLKDFLRPVPRPS